MSKYGSPSAFILIDGFDFLAPKLKSLSIKTEQINESNDGLGDNYEANAPVNKSRFMLTQSGGFFDTTTGSMHDAMATKLATTPQATPRIGCAGCMGMALGGVFWGFSGLFSTAYEVAISDGKLTKGNAVSVAYGKSEVGAILQPTATKSASWNTKSLGTQFDYTTDLSQRTVPITSNSLANPSVVTTPIPHGLTSGQVVLISGVATSSPTINGQRTVTVISPTTFSVPVNVATAGTGGSFVLASTVNGAAGYLQVKNYSGLTSIDVKIRTSADDTTYVDYITFTQVTAGPTAQRVAAAGTVDRYNAITGTIVGTGSADVFVGLSRF